VVRFLALAAVLLAMPTGLAHADDARRVYRTIETAHFRVNYYVFRQPSDGNGLEEVAQRLAVIAEDVHTQLSTVLGPGLSRHRKTEVLVTDEVDDSNGSATVQPYPAVRLFASAPDDRSELSDFDDWLRALFTHEYTHILHIGTIGGWCAPAVNAVLGWGRLGIAYAPNQTLPRFIIEGLAVFEETERTSGGRLRSSIWNMYLRQQTLEGRFQRIDQITHNPIQFPFGNSAYLYGSAFLRYVSTRFGESALRRFYDDYGSNCIPGALNRSLKRAVGRTWMDLYGDFRADLERRFTAERDALTRRGLTVTRRLVPPRPSLSRPAFLPDGTLIFNDSDGYSRSQIRQVGLDGKGLSTHHDVDGANGPSVSADGRFMLYAAAQPWHTFYDYFDLYLWDTQKKTERRLTRGLRANHPSIATDGSFAVFEINRASSRGLGRIDLASGKIDALLPPQHFEQVYTPTLSPDGTEVAFSWWREGGYRDIWVMKLATRQLTRITNDRSLDLEPRYSPDGKWLYFSSDRTSIFNLYAFDRESQKIYQVTNVLGGVFEPAISPDGRTVAFVGFAADGYVLETAALDPSTFVEAAPALLDRPESLPVRAAAPLPSKPYRPWRTMLPFYFQPFAQPGSYGEVLGLVLSGTDLVAHHAWSLSLGFSTGRADAVSAALNYSYTGIWPSLTMGAARSLGRRGGLRVNGVEIGYDEEAWSTGTSVGLPILRRRAQSADLGVSYSLSYTRSLTRPPEPDPTQLAPHYPDTGRTAGLAVGFSYSDARRYTYSVSKEEGREIGVTAAFGSRYLGGGREVYSAQWRWAEYLPIRWPRLHSHVLALSYRGGIAGGDPSRRQFFSLGGYAQQDLLTSIFDFSRPGSASLRGYPAGSQYGDSYHVVNLEYRFPIAWIQRGLYGTLPLYFKRLHGKVFADYGGAFLVSDGIRADRLKLGVGAEVILELDYFYYFPAALQLGYAYGANTGGGSQVYFLLNSPF